MASDASSLILVRRPDGSVEELPVERIDEIDQITAIPGSLVWVDVRNPDERLIANLQREFDLHPLAVEDMRKRGQRPKLDTYEDAHMVVTYEVVPDAVDLSEMHLFVGGGWLLSAQWGPTPMIDAARSRFASGRTGVDASVGQLLYSVLDAAVDSFFPELDRLSERIDTLEDGILAGDPAAQGLAEILALKRRLLELRRVLVPMRDLANALLRGDLEIVDASSTPYYRDLYDHLVRVLDQLDLYRDLLATVLDARLTVASNNLNAIMKRLTAFTVVLMVPTLIAGVYGMNFELMPELDWVLGYPFALALMAAAMVASVTWFRRRGWF